VEEALYALVLRRGSRRYLYIGSQRDPALRGGQSWEEYVDAVREGRGGAVTVRNRVRNGWTLESVLRGYGEETAVTFWARTALSGFPEWEVTGGLYALRPTPRNMAAMQVWEWQRLRLCTICGEPWHGAVHHDHEPGEAGELSETCGEVGTLQRELAASRGELDACRRTLEGLRGELAIRDRAAEEARRELKQLREQLASRDELLREQLASRDELLAKASEDLQAAARDVQAAEVARDAARAAGIAARRFPTPDEWLGFGPDARASEAAIREVVDRAEAGARRLDSGGPVRGKVLRFLGTEEYVHLVPLARVLLPPDQSAHTYKKWANELKPLVCRHGGEDAVRKEPRLGETKGRGNAPWVAKASALFAALAPEARSPEA
jgi:hypothetical protein